MILSHNSHQEAIFIKSALTNLCTIEFVRFLCAMPHPNYIHTIPAAINSRTAHTPRHAHSSLLRHQVCLRFLLSKRSPLRGPEKNSRLPRRLFRRQKPHNFMKATLHTSYFILHTLIHSYPTHKTQKFRICEVVTALQVHIIYMIHVTCYMLHVTCKMY